MVIAADDVRNLHQRVVNDDYVVVHRHSVGAQDDWIADNFAGKLDISMNDVMEPNRAFGNLQSNRARLAAIASAFGFFRINGPAFPRIGWLAVFGLGFLAFILKIGFRAKT